ncbi:MULTISPECIES: 4a-hydroxytetrahydrobiopterin dehydratase [unclassified Streptomyces]|uniref:4a-hydroxytetrahydrobiopterin dehydratase n=1 Tax=unclassified Streptomyces TaxID=2593676 RepID=UPI00035E1E4B|nr:MULTISPECIES: 4a-hydroxytetrahydrobiopterin dehydratase [unclassified Streptomyces]MYT30290.1 4a-hydroxytetrahydrobiopterin dehydratase [Streptomyces sp. SID8354]
MSAQVAPLDDTEIQDRLRELPGWTADGDLLHRGYRFDRHFQAAAMVMHIAQIQEELSHHAELTLGYNTLGVSVNTHSVGGRITHLDFGLARRIEEIAAGHGAR